MNGKSPSQDTCRTGKDRNEKPDGNGVELLVRMKVTSMYHEIDLHLTINVNYWKRIPCLFRGLIKAICGCSLCQAYLRRSSMDLAISDSKSQVIANKTSSKPQLRLMANVAIRMVNKIRSKFWLKRVLFSIRQIQRWLFVILKIYLSVSGHSSVVQMI